MFKISDFLETFPNELGLKNAGHHLFCSLWYFSVAVNRVATYRELDNDLLRQAAFQVLVSVVLKGPPPPHPTTPAPPSLHPGACFFSSASR